MRILEIILKLAFLVGAIFLIVTQEAKGQIFSLFLLVCVLLGITLIFNKRESYWYPKNYPKMKGVYLTRRIEGGLLIIFALIVGSALYI